MKLVHPVKGYTGPVNVGRRFWFVDGEAEATNILARHRRALEDAGFDVVNPHAAPEPDPEPEVDDEPEPDDPQPDE